jgi:hypothetical protein
VINLLVVFGLGLSKKGVIRESREENNTDSDSDSEGSSSKAISHSPEHRREIYWAYSPIDLQRLADFEDSLYKEFGFQIQGQISDYSPGDIQW